MTHTIGNIYTIGFCMTYLYASMFADRWFLTKSVSSLFKCSSSGSGKSGGVPPAKHRMLINNVTIVIKLVIFG